MSELASLPSNENLLNSVLSELKCRIKTPPPHSIPSQSNSANCSPEKSRKIPPTPPPQNTKPNLKNVLEDIKTEGTDITDTEEQDSDINGIADYAVYCRSVGLPSNLASNTSQNFTLTAKSSVKEEGVSRPKPSVPPRKPIRRNKPVHLQGKAKPAFQRGNFNDLPISSQFREFLESAFSSAAEKNEKVLGKRPRSKTDPHLRHENLSLSKYSFHSNSNTLKREDVNSYFKQSLESIDSGLEGSSKSTKPIDDIEDCFDVEGIYSIIDQTQIDSLSVDQLELVSTVSGQSDEGNHSHESGENEKVDEESKEADEISLSSNGSGDELAETKVIVRRIKARERARQLKKQATVHKERVGAFLDAAASNASDRIKKFRRPSLKFSHGKSKTLQNLASKIGASKNHEEAFQQLQNSGSENDECEKKASLLTSSVGNDPCKCDRKRTIKCGYLKKQGGKIKTWHERWFTLKGDKLYYHKDVDGKYLGTIYLSDARVVSYPPRTNSNDTHKYVFEVFPAKNNLGKMNTNHESFILSASSQADMEEWVKVIKRLILSPFGGGIFGQCLNETMRHDRRINAAGNTSSRNRSSRISHREVPIIVESCVEFIRSSNGLREEGLFRLPGQTNEVKELQDAYDMGERPVFSKSTDIHTIASLLKGYLRELPEPVIPFDRYHALIEAAKLSKSGEESPKSASSACELSKEKEEALKQIRDQILLFPQPNYDLLKYMCRFLDEVQRHSKSNKMDIYNLSMVFGPNMMRARQEDAVTMMVDAMHVQHVIYLLIDHHEYFFSDENKRKERMNGDAMDESTDDVNENGDAGIGTLTTTASPLGTLGLRHANDDSGTGSLAPTPDNTNKRAPAVVPNVQPPVRRISKPAKPIKPLRSKLSSHSLVNGNASPLPPPCDEDVRKSFYDNVTNSSAGSPDFAGSGSDWRRTSKDSSEFSGENANSTSQESYYVNNQNTPSSSSIRSSTHAVAGSTCVPESCFSSTTTENLSDPRMRFQPRLIRRPKIVRRPSRNLSDEESNTESIGTEDRPFSTLSSRSSCNNIDHSELSNHPRTSSCPILKYSNHLGASPSRGLTTGSGSDGGSSNCSVPTAPARIHRRTKNDDGGINLGGSEGFLRSSSRAATCLGISCLSYTPTQEHPFGKLAVSKHDSNHSILPPGSTRSSNMTSIGTGTSSCPLTYKEMEEQIRALTEELNKQRQEHEKRSRMLEEHYVMKMTGSSPSFTTSVISPDPYSAAGFLHHHHPSFSSIKEVDDLPGSPAGSIAFREMSITDESGLDPVDSCYCQHTPSAVSRALSTESQAEMRYREEMKRHAMTKIRLRNAERGLKQAEERNEHLQKEMENFFETFGSMIPQ